MLQTLATMFRYDSCGNKEEKSKNKFGSIFSSEGRKEQKAHATMQILFTPKKKA
jgi:hypothetical protein